MQQIADILPKVADSLGIQKQYKIQLILYYWDRIVGADIAAQADPVDIEYGVLFLSVPNSVWCHHLSMMKAEILQKVNAFVGEAVARDMRFKNHVRREKRGAAEDSPADHLMRRLRKVRLAPEEARRAEAAAAAVRETALAQRAARLYKQHLRLNQLKREEKWHACAACGVLCSEDQSYCSICALERRQALLSQIRRALWDVPWASYAEINRYISCAAREYIDAKVTLLHRVAASIGEDEAGMQAKILTMLFTGAKPEALSERLVQKTLAKFRRKRYVSALGR